MPSIDSYRLKLTYNKFSSYWSKKLKSQRSCLENNTAGFTPHLIYGAIFMMTENDEQRSHEPVLSSKSWDEEAK
ncbi:MAG TPA: hypothetical protein V6D12_01820 [Candidatus Obscuribacterales bacterium]